MAPGPGQRKYKWIPEHLTVPESKEFLKDGDMPKTQKTQKGLPLAKAGTTWVLDVCHRL